jgi:hypothetical protein
MPNMTDLIESLLWEDESNTLDFKETQYPFAGATETQKSELIKDVLAFANAFRRDDAYILIGVKDVKGARGILTGVSNHLDDAHLQQLVNSKTNHPVEFSYHALDIDGKQVGAIHIPRQPRPSYVLKPYGKLHGNTVYLRHGSSTSVATPEEIARMGIDHAATTTPTPQLSLQFADRTTHFRHGTTATINSLILLTPEDIPDYRDEQHTYLGTYDSSSNRDYHRDLVKHTTFLSLAHPHGFAVENTSSITAEDVRLTITIDDPAETLGVFGETDVPQEPDPRSILQRMNYGPPPQHDLHVRRTGTQWQITATFGKIQPKATVYLRSRVYLGAYQPTTITITALLYADNLPSPIDTSLHLQITATERTVSLDETRSLHAEWYFNTPRGKAFKAKIEKRE